MSGRAGPAEGWSGETASGFAVIRIPRNGELPADYLRSFEVVGRNGLGKLAFGPRGAAQLFDRRAEAEDIARRLRRRPTLGDYDYAVEQATGAVAPA